MIFDVIVREGFNEKQKEMYKIYRVHISLLSRFVREKQDDRKYIYSIRLLVPLHWNKKREEMQQAVNEVVNELHGIHTGIEEIESDL